MQTEYLNERCQEILKVVVHSYIDTAGPVGSRTITKRYNIGLSPATIRNIMADLADMGFLTQPHTSAGRVPTDKGYRFYVDSIINSKGFRDINNAEKEMSSRLEITKGDIKGLMQETSRMLSLLSHYLGVVLAPRLEDSTYKRMDFVRLKDRHILVIFISDEEIVHNRIIEIDEDITQKDLNRISNFLSRELYGLSLKEVRRKIFSKMYEEKMQCDRLIKRALSICREMVMAGSEGDVYIGGIADLLDLPEFADLRKIKELFKAIEDKHLLLKLLDKTMETDGLRVFIGEENPLCEMKNCAIVTSTYKEGDKPLGALGIIGPTRMNYSEVIPIVDYTAMLLSRLLSQR